MKYISWLSVLDKMFAMCWWISVDAREAGEGTLDVAITEPTRQPLVCDVSTDNHGAYAVTYKPIVAGTHRVDIHFNGECVIGKQRAVDVSGATSLE